MKINSGCQDFDLFLEGGYESGLITGFYGAASTGKTTLVMLAALEQIKRGKKVLHLWHIIRRGRRQSQDSGNYISGY